jgi:hypothetical protein
LKIKSSKCSKSSTRGKPGTFGTFGTNEIIEKFHPYIIRFQYFKSVKKGWNFWNAKIDNVVKFGVFKDTWK